MAVRSARRCLLVAAAIAVLLFAACTPAWAGEEGATATSATPVPAIPDAPATPDTTALARSAIADGELDDALRLLSRVVVSERPEDERAAAAELRSVVERWVALGRTIALPSRAGAAPSVPSTYPEEPGVADATPDDGAWEGAFSFARGRLIAGRFEDAARGFAVLVEAARTQRTMLRAHALASLASELVGKGAVLRTKERQPLAVRGSAPDYHRDPRASGTRRWYGWQTLIADTATVTLVPAIGSQLDKEGGGVALGMATSYLLAAPIIHLANGHPGTAAASLGLRTGMPMSGALLGAALASGCHDAYCGLGAAAVGFVLGAVGAVAVDAAVLSYEPRETDAPAGEDARSASPPMKKGIALTPLGGPRKDGGLEVGVGAVF